MTAGRRRSKPVPLRRRVALAFTALGFVLSLLFSIAVVAVAEQYEHVLAAEILRGQAEDYSLRLSNGLPATLPRTHRLSGYRGHEVPANYAAFAPGVSEDAHADGVHVGVFDTSAGRLTFVIDLSDIEQLERLLNLFLAAMVVVGTTLAGWLGWLFAGASLAPVTQLAAAVEALPVQPRPSRLRDRASDDELGRLAWAIDAYQSRLVEADSHEQAFFADASHELRTPIAVVQGVAELLLDEAVGDPAQAARLQRLERGVQELAELLEAMLGIARRTPLKIESIDADALLREAAAPLRALAPLLDIVIDADGQLQTAHREALLLLRGVLRRLVAPGARGTLRLRFAGIRLELTLHDPAQDDAAAASPSSRSDRGQAAVLTQRLADRLGWTMDASTAGTVRFVVAESTREQRRSE